MVAGKAGDHVMSCCAPHLGASRGGPLRHSYGTDDVEDVMGRLFADVGLKQHLALLLMVLFASAAG